MKLLDKSILSFFVMFMSSICIAYGIWYISSQSTLVEKTIHVPVYIIHNDADTLHTSKTIQVTLQGTLPSIRSLDASSIALHVDAHQCKKPIDWIAIKESDLSIPYDVKLVHCYPSMLTVTTQL